MTKTLVVVEMLVLWLGTINHYKGDYKNDLGATLAAVGVRSAVPTAILAFWLLLLSDLGGGKIAAVFGGIVAFSYLMGSVDLINEITDSLLQYSAPPSKGSSGAV